MLYRLVSAGVLPHTAPMYRWPSARLARARREGRFPGLIDTVRNVHVPESWPDADAFVRQMPEWFRLDRTAGQQHALYVATEKDTLRQQLTGRLAEYGIPVLVVRGFGSRPYADVVRRRTALDSSEGASGLPRGPGRLGMDIERDWGRRTGCWSRVHPRAAHVRAGARVRSAGDRRQARRPAVAGLRPPPRPRPARPVQWEVEALEPRELQRLVLAAVGPVLLLTEVCPRGQVVGAHEPLSGGFGHQKSGLSPGCLRTLVAKTGSLIKPTEP